jgi:membrane-associated protein
VTLLVDFVLHLDRHLGELIQSYGLVIYAILFAIVFCETGFVVIPFLPGDSLLFATGTLAARGDLDLALLIGLLSLAGIAGDTVNYWMGHKVGPKVFKKKQSRFFKKEHLDRTHAFYDKYGGKTIVIARFVPIVRTLAPFVAGLGAMTYWKFITYNVVGGLGWVVSLTLTGYFFGNIPLVKRNLSLATIVIIVISVLPMIIEYLHARRQTA